MKRLLAFAIAVMMVFAMVPVSVSAADVLPTPAAVDGVLTLGEGTYRLCTGHLSLNGITEINGAGVGKTFLVFFNDGGDNVAIYIAGSDRNIKVSNVTIDGTGVTRGCGFKTEYRSSNVEAIFENCEFKNLNLGIYLDHTAKATITNCTFSDCAYAIGTDFEGNTDSLLTVVDSTFANYTEAIGWLGGSTLRIENVEGIDSFVDYGTEYGTSGTPVNVTDGYGEWTRADGGLDFTDIAPEPEPEEKEEPKANFFLFMFMKRLLTEYAVELVFDDTMGIVEVDDEDGYVRFSNDAVITVAALEGYEVESVLVNGEAVELDEDGTYTIKRIRKDAKVEVTFAEIVEEEIEDAE